MRRTHLALAAFISLVSILTITIPLAAADELAGTRLDVAPFAQSYCNTPYLWTGAVEICLQCELKPAPGHKLMLLSGCKNDSRSATIVINGQPTTVADTGHDGFRWLAVDLPQSVLSESKPTTGYDIVITRPNTWAAKPGFFAALRIVDKNVTPEQMDKTLSGSALPMTVTCHDLPTYKPETFPEMQPLWDTPIKVPATGDAKIDALLTAAERNSRLANEMLYRSRRFVDGWLDRSDPTTGLIPRNLNRDKDIWNAKDSAADNYPFMVLTCDLTDRELFEGRMLDMLQTETQLTCRLGALPDTWRFSTQSFDTPEPKRFDLLFGGSEYAKDGLTPITEWLGESPWSERLIAIVDDMFRHADYDTPYGMIPTNNIEVHGEMLQVLSRVYSMTGEPRYLDWACRIGDYYLLGDHHPTRDQEQFRLNDHGCEITSGLSELYVILRQKDPVKADTYQKPLDEMYDTLLATGRNELGFFYDWVKPKTGEHSGGITDNWAYNLLGYYTIYQVDGKTEYREAVVKSLKNLPELLDYNWGNVADEYADSIEGALCLYNREPVPEAAAWMESEIHDMWEHQTPDGIIEGWHGDGNVARTAIMFALWKTRGLHVEPWREDVRIGAEQDGATLYIVLTADEPWQGKVRFDRPRHRDYLHLPHDYPRLNQFPEWFTAETDSDYVVTDLSTGNQKTAIGTMLHEGLSVQLDAGEVMRLKVE